MDKKEFAILADAIKSFYPKETLIPTPQAATLWYEELKDLDFDTAMTAVKMHVHSSQWAPTIFEIRSKVADMRTSGSDWSDGWEQVTKAVGRFGYLDEAGALASMDPETAAVVKRLGWKQICMTNVDDIGTLRANFRMIYQQKSEKQKQEQTVPDALKDTVSGLIKSMEQKQKITGGNAFER